MDLINWPVVILSAAAAYAHSRDMISTKNLLIFVGLVMVIASIS